MKKLMMVLTVMFLPVVFMGGCKAPTTSDLKAPDAAYELDTWGTNSEVYEFTTKRGQHCVVFMLDNLISMDMECTQ